jgi:PAS domain S-box-containing protein
MEFVPVNEKERLEVLRAYDVLDTLPEEDLDAITRLASEICQTPVALISFVDHDRQWFKSKVGLDMTESPRDVSFCRHTILEDDIYEVSNALENKLFAGNPFVTGETKVRFYAGVPLIAPGGYNLGALCVIDSIPKKLTETQKDSLRSLSRLVMNYLELRVGKKQLEAVKNQYYNMVEGAGDIIYTTDIKGVFVYVSKAVVKITGYGSEEIIGRHYTELIAPDWEEQVTAFYSDQLKNNTPESSMEFEIMTRHGERKWVEQNVVIQYEKGTPTGFQAITRDISGRKQTELKLAEAGRAIDETRHTLQSILDNTSSIIFIKNLNHQYILINRQFEKVFEIGFDQVHLRTDYDFREKGVARTMQSSDRQVLKKKKPLDFEYSFRIRDKKRTFLVTKFPLFDSEGDMYGVCGVYTEITAQKQVQELLRERDERFSKIFHSSPAAMTLSLAETNRIVEANQGFICLTGYPQDEVLGQNTEQIGLLEAQERIRILKIYEEQGYVRDEELCLKHKTGEIRQVLLSSEHLNIDNREHILDLYYDITERKQAEEELARTKALLVEAMSIGRMGSFEYNIRDGKVFLSKEVYDIMERPPETMPLNMEGYIQAIHPDDREMVLKKMEDSLKVRKPDVTINRFITPSQNEKWIETRVVPVFDEQGEILQFKGTMQDITEQKKSEEALREAKNLAEQSAMAKENFLANMSHEIRTPMNSVLGFTDLLLRTSLDAEQREFVNAVKASGNNLMTIINDILDYSKIEAGMMTMEEVSMNIEDLFSSLFVLFHERAKEKKLRLNFSTDKQIPAGLLGDPVRFTQIVTNLVGNAIKFTEQGGIEVSASLAARQEDRVTIRLRVEDTGIGIPADKQAEIFERFNQGKNDTTRRYGGTGLGLSIVKKLAELHGGSVHVKRGAVQGSVFEVILNYKLSLPEAGTEEATPFSRRVPERTGPLEILLVEDNVFNQKLAQKVLTGFGFMVDIASNGKEGVERIRERKYDLVLMDIQMPEMNGYEVTGIVRNELNNPVPIMAMTAHAMGSEKERCLALGMNDYISKPFDIEELYHKILDLVSGKDKTPEALSRDQPDTPASLLNMSYLERITGGDREMIMEILTEFTVQIPKDLSLLKQFIVQNDLVSMQEQAHKLKSSLPVVGLDRAAGWLSELEDLARAGADVSRADLLFKKVEDSCGQVISEISAMQAGS